MPHAPTVTVFAVPMTCADDQSKHLVRDDLAAAVLTLGGSTPALCGHQLAPAFTAQPGESCVTCRDAADQCGLVTP